MTDPLSAAAALAESDGSGALLTLLSGDLVGVRALVDRDARLVSGEIPEGLLEVARAEVMAAIETERTGTIDVGGFEVFVDVITPPPVLRIFGGGPIAEALSRIAAPTGFRVVVGDPRLEQARPERFPDAYAVHHGWPDDLIDAHPLDHRTFVVSLLHEHRFEETLLPIVLRSDVRYVGALGSRKTHAARVAHLEAEGFTAGEIARIHGPVGLSIGARTPEEIAVSILAEVVQVRRS